MVWGNGLNAQTAQYQRKNQHSANSLSGDENSSSKLFKILPDSVKIDVKKDIREAVFLELNFAELARIIKVKSPLLTINLPVSQSNRVTFALHDAKIVTDNFSIITEKNEKVKYTPGLYYQGTVSGVNPSLAAWSMFDNSIMAVFSFNNENYTLGLWNDKSNIDNTIYILYKDSDALFAQKLKCEVDDDLPKKLSDNGNTGHLLSNQCVKVYFECDYQMLLDKGSVINVGNYVTGIFNFTQLLFYNEAINTEISEIYVWTSTDPYVSYSLSLDFLTNFEINRPTFNGNVAYLLTTRNLDFTGRASNELCYSSAPHSYGNIHNSYAAYPNYSAEIEVFTHELGHNFGSHHTHWCGWVGGAIDDCATTEGGCVPGPAPTNGGTIMSYCFQPGNLISFTNGFGVQPGNAIRALYNSASCLTACANSPTAYFTASPTIGCSAPKTVTFTDKSQGLPTSWKWDIDNNGSTDYTTQSPTHVYSTAGTYSVKLIATNANGSDTIIKTNYITVGNITAGVSLPLAEGFEGSGNLPSAWSLSNPDNDATWVINTSVAHSGLHSISFDNCLYIGSFGKRDIFYTKNYNMSSGAFTLSFDVAYARKNYQGTIYIDTLSVYASSDCGATWNKIYHKGGTTLETAPISLYCFAPTSSQWRTETINMTSFTGQPIVMLGFENITGGGNRLYIDNINISATVATGIDNFADDGTSITIYPNPFSKSATIKVQSTNSLQPTALDFILYDLVGKEVMRMDNISDQTQILADQLSQGLYVYKVFNKQKLVSKGKIVIQ